MSSYTIHIPVLLEEILLFSENLLNKKSEINVLDLTFGGGGHSLALLDKYKSIDLTGVDQDPDVHKNFLENEKFIPFRGRINLVKENFSNFISKTNNQKYDLVLIDLGISSHQIDSEIRGFSFKADAPLDMRMDKGSSNLVSAADILNTYPAAELQKIFTEYGEEKFSKRIALEVVEFRKNKLFQSTKELENLVFHCYPKKLRFGRLHPATKVFQALRIAVNQEIEVIKSIFPKIFELLNRQSRLLIISFHSLEDRVVKHEFKKVVLEKPDQFKILTKKPVIPTLSEIERNSRSRSAKLRVLEKL